MDKKFEDDDLNVCLDNSLDKLNKEARDAILSGAREMLTRRYDTHQIALESSGINIYFYKAIVESENSLDLGSSHEYLVILMINKSSNKLIHAFHMLI